MGGTGEDRQVYVHLLGLCGVVLTTVCRQLAVGRYNDSLAITATSERQTYPSKMIFDKGR